MSCIETREELREIKDKPKDTPKYMLVVRWNKYEVSVYEFDYLEEVNDYLEKHPYVTKERYWIAKVLFEG